MDREFLGIATVFALAKVQGVDAEDLSRALEEELSTAEYCRKMNEAKIKIKEQEKLDREMATVH